MDRTTQGELLVLAMVALPLLVIALVMGVSW